MYTPLPPLVFISLLLKEYNGEKMFGFSLCKQHASYTWHKPPLGTLRFYEPLHRGSSL